MTITVTQLVIVAVTMTVTMKVTETDRMAKTVTTIEGDITVPLTNSDSNSTFYRDSDRDRVSDSGSGYKVASTLDNDR